MRGGLGVLVVLALLAGGPVAAGVPGCVSDPQADAGGGQDLTEVCALGLRTGLAVTVTFAAPPVLGGPDSQDTVRLGIQRAGVTVALAEGLVATHGWSPTPSPLGPPPPCGDFNAAVEGTTLTVAYLPAACYDLGAPVVVTGPGGADTVDGPVAPAPAATDLALPASADTTATTLAWSQATFPDGGARRALLARDDAFADALTSSGLQAERFAPLLVTSTGALDPRVQEELQRLGTRQVTILGGEAAVGPSVEAALRGQGLAVDRIAGGSRIETALAIAEQTRNDTVGALTPAQTVLRAFAAEGGDPTAAYADALALGSLGSSVMAKPFLLTDSAALSAATAARFPPTTGAEAWLVGGEAAIGPGVQAELEDRGYAVVRLAGATRFGTAAQVAQRSGGDVAVVLVEGSTPDAWAAGFAAAAHLAAVAGGDVLLSAGATLPQETAEALAAYQGRPVRVCAPGVDAAACAAAAAALGA